MKTEKQSREPIDQDDFPALFRHADRSAAVYQRRYRMLINVLVVTSAGATLLGVVGNLRIRMGLTAILTGFQLVAALSNTSQGWNTKWYRARAVAETAKSLTWRYAVGGNPFPLGTTGTQMSIDFHNRMRNLLVGIHDKGLLLPSLKLADEDMSRVETLRESTLDNRQQVYLKHRVRDQESWYRSRMISLGRRRNVLSAVSIVSASLAIVLSIYLVGQPRQPVTAVVSFLASISLGMIAIGQSKNLSTDVAAYQLTHYEIKPLLGDAMPRTEADWAVWVDATEELFSREHTMWLGNKRMTPVLPPVT